MTEATDLIHCSHGIRTLEWGHGSFGETFLFFLTVKCITYLEVASGAYPWVSYPSSLAGYPLKPILFNQWQSKGLQQIIYFQSLAVLTSWFCFSSLDSSGVLLLSVAHLVFNHLHNYDLKLFVASQTISFAIVFGVSIFSSQTFRQLSQNNWSHRIYLHPNGTVQLVNTLVFS